jgi:hypothetical protein
MTKQLVYVFSRRRYFSFFLKSLSHQSLAKGGTALLGELKLPIPLSIITFNQIAAPQGNRRKKAEHARL